MLAIAAAAVLFAIGQAQTTRTAMERAGREEVTAALKAKAHADDAAEEALAGLDRVRAQAVEQLVACQTAAEQAQAAARAARTELAEVRAAAAKAVTAAREAAEAAIQKAIADRDWGLAERGAEMRQQIEQVKTDAQAQVKTDAQAQVKTDARAQVKAMGGELTAPPVQRATRLPAKQQPKQPPKQPPN